MLLYDVYSLIDYKIELNMQKIDNIHQHYPMMIMKIVLLHYENSNQQETRVFNQ